MGRKEAGADVELLDYCFWSLHCFSPSPMGLQPCLGNSNDLYNESCYVEIIEVGIYTRVTSMSHTHLTVAQHKSPFPSPSVGSRAASRSSLDLRD